MSVYRRNTAVTRQVGADVNMTWDVDVNVNFWVIRHQFLRRLPRWLMATLRLERVDTLFHGLLKTWKQMAKYAELNHLTPRFKYTDITIYPSLFNINQSCQKDVPYKTVIQSRNGVDQSCCVTSHSWHLVHKAIFTAPTSDLNCPPWRQTARSRPRFWPRIPACTNLSTVL